MESPDKPAEITESPDERREMCEAQRIRAVGKSTSRIVVNLHENAVDTGGYTSFAEHLNELRLATASSALTSRQLERVGHVQNDWISHFSHNRKPPHVHD